MATRKKASPTSPADPVTAYAKAVVSGKTIAGPHVRAQCARHLRDLKEGADRGLVWDLPRALHALGFFPDILRLNGGQYEGKPFTLLGWQAFVVGSMFGWIGSDGFRRFRVAYVETAKGPLALDTRIPTPSGWTTMGEIEVGDHVFDDAGRPTRVTAVSPVFFDRECFRLTFGDGTQIVADAEHRWNTAALRSGMKPGPRKDSIRKGGYAKRTTSEIARTLKMGESTSVHPQAKWNHRVDVAPPLELPDVDLVVPPYTLGAWLGDGDTDCARLTVAYADWQIVEEIAGEGTPTSEQVKHSTTTARVCLGGDSSQAARNVSPQARLRAIGVLGDKHIPAMYLRAGTRQRLALLQGLMDTDGTVAVGGKCELTLCSERLSLDSLALIRSLGFKAEMRASEAKLNGRVVGTRWRIGFQAYKSLPPFRLRRKAVRLGDAPKTRPLSAGRMIVGCDPVESVPVRCITVEAESHMFLAGDGLVPTCNSGKSPLAAGFGLIGLVADKEPRAEIYSAAVKKDQAQILFRDAVAMVDQSPELAKRLTKSGKGERCWNLAYLDQGSFFRPISSDEGQSGPRPHIALIDEIHEHRSNTVIELVRAGTKSRRQALMFMITNSGANKLGPCWAYHEYGVQVANGTKEDDAFFPYICGLDETDDPFQSEDCWPKANPSLQEADLPGYKYIREQVREAQGMPSKESIVRRLNFCQWTEAENPWISTEVWKGAKREYDIESLRGRRAVAAMDLSSTTDLTGLVFFVEPAESGEPWKIVPFGWMPEHELARKSEKDVRDDTYVRWVAQGYLLTTPGRAISKRMVLQKLSAMCDFFEVSHCAYDRWRIEDLIALASDEGITLPKMIPFGQGYQSMSPAVEEFERMLLNGELVHDGHPVLTMCMMNAVTASDAAENRKLDKEKATGRIDLAVAAVMAAGTINEEAEEAPTPQLFFI